jgi:hypothetical protein
LAASLVWAACEKTDDSLLDSRGTPPTIAEASVSPTAIDTDSILVGPSKQPDDILQIHINVSARIAHPGGRGQISTAQYSVRREGTTSILTSGDLNDAGSEPDQIEGDGLYAGRATFSIKRVEVGTYFVDVAAADPRGLTSNTFILPVRVTRSNLPPVLTDLQAADTVRLASQDQFLVLQVRATDPNGLEDLQRVVFNSFRPDDSPSSGNPFQMYDDGDPGHGDTVQGDGIFSLRVVLPVTTQTGMYRFEFQAFDRSGEGSNVIIHRIRVLQ